MFISPHIFCVIKNHHIHSLQGESSLYAYQVLRLLIHINIPDIKKWKKILHMCGFSFLLNLQHVNLRALFHFCCSMRIPLTFLQCKSANSYQSNDRNSRYSAKSGQQCGKSSKFSMNFSQLLTINQYVWILPLTWGYVVFFFTVSWYLAGDMHQQCSFKSPLTIFSWAFNKEAPVYMCMPSQIAIALISGLRFWPYAVQGFWHLCLYCLWESPSRLGLVFSFRSLFKQKCYSILAQTW